MEKFYKLLIVRTENLAHLGFKVTSDSDPYKDTSRIGRSWYHKTLDIHFAVVWDRMDMFLISCNIKEYKHFNPFYKSLDKYKIEYDCNKLSYGLQKGRQFDSDLFSETLDYNLKKLGELLMIVGDK